MLTNIDLKKFDPRLSPGCRVLVAMSGGVDSSVVAALLHQAGCEVVGVSMHLFDKSGSQPGRCCTLDDFQDARRVAYELGFPHHVMDFRERFRADVIEGFIRDYEAGRTPSPCILCNQHLKFDALLSVAEDLGAEFVATGHYARIDSGAGRYRLFTGRSQDKDQAYFLFHHTQKTLARTLFPLGGLAKPEVRQLGQDLGLHLASKAESQEICFIPSHYTDFLKTSGLVSRPGVIRHVDGRILGEHPGHWHFTVGQRRGIGIAHSEPLYVVRIEAESGTVWIGEEAQLYADRLKVQGLSWVGEAPGGILNCQAKIRSRASTEAAQLRILGAHTGEVTFAHPQRAIAPGQAVVFFEGEEILGGGWIQAT